MIPDAEYILDMEGVSVNTLIAQGIMPYVLVPHQNILTLLQRVHDEYDDSDLTVWKDYLKYRLTKLAQKQHLTYKVIA